MNPDAAGSSYEGSEPYEQKVGYGRHATHRLSLSRETQVGPRGLKRFRARVENLFLQNESFGGPPTLRMGICHARISRLQKYCDFPRPFEILLGDVSLDGWAVIIDRGGLA